MIKQQSAKAEIVEYKLINGDLITGELIVSESSDKKKVISHKYLGRIEIEVSSIINPKPKYWSNNLEFGLDGSSTSSSESIGYLLELNTNYQDKKQEFNLGTNYGFEKTSKTNGESIKSLNKSSTAIRYDKSIENSWTSYISTDYEYNALKEIGVNDIKSSAGIGYKILDNSNTMLRFSAGPSIAIIDGGDGCSQEANCGIAKPGGSFESNFRWNINQKLELLIDNNFNTQFTSESYNSNNLSTAIRFYPSNKSDLYTSLSYENIYASIKEPSHEHYYKLKIGTKF